MTWIIPKTNSAEESETPHPGGLVDGRMMTVMPQEESGDDRTYG
jgi:hypothetical protein